MADYFQEFPHAEIRDDNGDYFNTVADAVKAGHPVENIWSVVECAGTITYGPSRHYINRLGYVATVFSHDGDTYYHEECEIEEDAEEDSADD